MGWIIPCTEGGRVREREDNFIKGGGGGGGEEGGGRRGEGGGREGRGVSAYTNDKGTEEGSWKPQLISVGHQATTNHSCCITGKSKLEIEEKWFGKQMTITEGNILGP